MKRTALLRWILPVLGICLVLLIAAAATLRMSGDREPLTASAASGDVYYAMPTVCPECGEPPDTNPSAGGSLTFTCIDDRCSYRFVHTGNRGGFTHSGTVTIHTASYVEGRDPTCTSSGYYGYSRCSVCGSFISSMTTIPATGHDYGEWFETIPATCTSQGQEQRACRNKGCSARETRAVAANGHTWDSGTVTLSPTCQRTGTMTYECTSCGGTKTETISKTSHDYSIYRSRIEPTCTSSGRTSGYECRWCSATTCSTLPALGHSYGAYSVTEQPSCTEEGKETAKCSRCSATQTRTASALGHEEVTDEVDFAKFGRRAILNLRQTLASKILELEKDSLYNKYIDKVGTIISAEVYQIWKKEILLLDDDGNELLLPKTEQIPSDFYRKGETARAVVARVDNKNNNPKIILSRTSPIFLQRLLEQEVPEINDGLITVKKIARIPGERAKIAVESYDDRIDPVGACVGVKGSRIHGIVRELRNENIDVINYTANTQLFIQRALSPAKISSIRLNEEEHKAEVFLKPEEVSLAIGKNGQNIKLASMLTEYTIDVFRELPEGAPEDEDIYLDEFRDEIEGWVVDAIKGIGIDTAKAVLNAPREMLIEKADLEEETVDDVLRILRKEFEE